MAEKGVIAGREVVRGDRGVLQEGDRVPADAVVLSAVSLSVDESLLTGESVPVRKLPGVAETPISKPGGEDTASVFSGTIRRDWFMNGPEPLLFAEHHHVGSVVSAGHGESLAIGRPLEVGDAFRSEVRDLVSGRTVEGLGPDVIHALIANDVGDGLSVGSAVHDIGEACRGYPWIGLKQSGRRLSA